MYQRKTSFNCGKQEIFMKSLPSKDQGNLYFCLHLRVCLPCYCCSVALAVLCDFFFSFFHLKGSCLKCVCLLFICCCFPRQHWSLLQGTFDRWFKICRLCNVAEEEDAEEVPEFQVSGKIGAKKQRKLEEKQARKAQREVRISCHVLSRAWSAQQRTGDKKSKGSVITKWLFYLKNVNSALAGPWKTVFHFLSIQTRGEERSSTLEFFFLDVSP